MLNYSVLLRGKCFLQHFLDRLGTIRQIFKHKRNSLIGTEIRLKKIVLRRGKTGF